MIQRVCVCLLILLCVIDPKKMYAQDEEDFQPPSWPGLSFFYDGGMIPFFYGSLTATLLLPLWIDLPEEPRLFSSEEGGNPKKVVTVPKEILVGQLGVTTIALLATPTSARWYHTQGLLESFATTALVTQATKLTFGRHRPNYNLIDESLNTEDQRKSFFSGHASSTLSTATYLGLYLHNHVFSHGRRGQFSWSELPVGFVLVGWSTFVPYSRVIDNDHHPSDVIVGSLVGFTSAVLFYSWQQHRYESSLMISKTSSPIQKTDTSFFLMPDLEHAGVNLMVAF